MKLSKVIKIAIDAAMFILFGLLVGYHLLPRVFHEWAGISVFILFIVHSVLNWRWYAVLFKGKYPAIRVIQTVVNLLLCIAMVGCMASAILIAREAFDLSIRGIGEIVRMLHFIATAWTFILMSIHLGLHWRQVLIIGQKVTMNKTAKTILVWLFRVFVLAICAFGIYVFIIRRYWEGLFLVTPYAFLDDSKSVFVYLLESVALSALFVSIAYYTKKLILYVKRKNSEVKQRA